MMRSIVPSIDVFLLEAWRWISAAIFERLFCFRVPSKWKLSFVPSVLARRKFRPRVGHSFDDDQSAPRDIDTRSPAGWDSFTRRPSNWLAGAVLLLQLLTGVLQRVARPRRRVATGLF